MNNTITVEPKQIEAAKVRMIRLQLNAVRLEKLKFYRLIIGNCEN